MKHLCLLALLLMASLAFAQTTKQPSVQDILNPDGTLRLEKDGSYSLDGYQLQTDAQGRPIVSPLQTMQTQSGAGGWVMGVGLPDGVNGSVTAVAAYNGELYIAGGFNQAGGMTANRIARWNGTSWNSVGTGSANGVNGSVSALVVYNGELYVGGTFTQAGGMTANNIARWNGTSWNSVGTGSANGVNNTVLALGVYNGELYAGGYFTQAGGATANRIARWNGASWSPIVVGSNNGVDNDVHCFAEYNGELYVGGYFSAAGGLAVNKIARWNGTSWSRVGVVYGVGGSASRVRALAVYGGELYVGGDFTSAGEFGSVNCMARWNGTSWNSVGAGPNNGVGNIGAFVLAFHVHQGELYVGGNFTQAGGMTARNIARWNGTAWDTVGAANALGGTSPTVQTFATFDGELYVGGGFTSASGVNVNRIARWNGTRWNAVGGGVNNQVTALAVYNGELYVGGGFISAGGVSVNRIARWNGSFWNSVGTGAANGVSSMGIPSVTALAVYNGELYVGGSFTTAGGATANNIARWNGTSWNSVGTGSANGVNGSVSALMVYNGELYVGGSFTQAGGATANRIARWNGTSWNSVGTGSANGVSGGSSPYVAAFAVYNGELYVGGDFNQAGGTFRFRIARWNGTAWNNVAGGTNGPVLALAVYNGALFVGGTFTQVDGFNVLASRVARWNGTSWSAVGAPATNGVSGTTPGVYVMTVYNGDLYVGGKFSSAGGMTANNLVRWNGSAWDSVGTNGGNGVSDVVSTCAVYNGSLFIGGYFAEVNVGQVIPSYRFAQWRVQSGASASGANTVSGDGVFVFSPTGVSIAFTDVSGSGSCAVERYDAPASNVSFSGAPPTFVSSYRFVITATGFSFASAELRFNRTQIPNAGISNAATVTVYRRPSVGTGAFAALPNVYNASFPDEARATTTAFSEFVLGSDDNQLPVELVEFIGRKTESGVLLSWRTASELNNAGFEVQRRSANRGASSEGWQTLGFVRGAGTTTEAQSYSFLDRTASGKVQYRLKQMDFDGRFEYSPIVEVDASAPRTFALEQNYPNPFNPTTTIQYQLPVASEVSLKVYDMLGREAMTLVNGRQEAGSYSVSLNGANLASGIYFYRLRAGSFVATKKMMLVK